MIPHKSTPEVIVNYRGEGGRGGEQGIAEVKEKRRGYQNRQQGVSERMIEGWLSVAGVNITCMYTLSNKVLTWEA